MEAAEPQAQEPLTLIERDTGPAIELRHPYNAELVDAMRAIGARFTWNKDRKGGVWAFPITAGTAPIILTQLQRWFVVPDAVRGMAIRAQDQARELEHASSAEDAELQIAGLGGELRGYQKAAVRYAIKTRRLIIGDDVGLGKTVEALATLQALDAFPAIIVVPASAVLQWRRMARRWLPDRKTAVIEQDGYGMWNTDIVLMSYGIVHRFAGRWWKKGNEKAEQEAAKTRDLVEEIGAKALVADESHKLKASKARRTQAVANMARRVPTRLLLTATAIKSRPSEFIAQLRMLGRLDDLGGFWKFVHTYCQAEETPYGLNVGGAANLKELNQKLRATCYIRRERSTVMPELPPVERNPIPFEIANRAEYDAESKGLVDWLRGGGARPERKAEQLTRIEKLKQLAAAGKLNGVQDWIEDFLEGDEKLVVYCTHVAIGQRLASHFKVGYYHGATSKIERDRMLWQFVEDPATRLFVANLQAGGEAVDGLQQAASQMAIVEFGWTPGDHDQVEGRLSRSGQERRVTAHYMIGKGTIDEWMLNLVEQEKRGVTEMATKGESVVARQAGANMGGLIQWLMQQAA